MSELSQMQREKLCRIFRQFDSDGNGTLSLREFRRACRRFSPVMSVCEIDRLALEVHCLSHLNTLFCLTIISWLLQSFQIACNWLILNSCTITENWPSNNRSCVTGSLLSYITNSRHV